MMAAKKGKKPAAPAVDPKAVFPLTPEEERLVRTAANSVWNEIAYDCLEGNGGRDMPRDQVIEVVLDADRLRSRLRYDKKAMASQGLATLITVWGDWKHTDWQVADARMQALCEETFPLGRYGL